MTPDGAQASEPVITLYWRPGCGFCAMLRRTLRKAGVPTTDVNIWEDKDAAATVRGAARGNETVPTVSVAGEFMVNPSAGQVIAAATAAGVDLPDAPRRRWGRGGERSQ